MSREGHLLLLATAGFMWVGCDSGLPAASTLDSVRILAVQSDLPYAPPGATVTSEVLAYDGRPQPATRPMRTYWLRDICLAPKDDEPEDCYRRFADLYPRDQDLSARLTEGPTASFVVPSDALQGAEPRPGATEPSTSFFAFVAACAGELRFVGARPSYPAEVPFACVDEAGDPLDRTHFVLAFARVFVFAERRNANPSLQSVTLDGVALDEAAPHPVPRCEGEDLDACPWRPLGVTVSDATQEIDPGSAPPGGAPAREQVWSSFFTSQGEVESEVLLQFDARRGRLPAATNGFRGPIAAGDVELFVVTHDNRAGVSWRRFTLRAQ